MHPNALYELSVLDDHILNKLNPGNTTDDLTDEKLEQYVSLIKIEARTCRWKIVSKARSLLDKRYVTIFIQNHQEQLCFLINQLHFYRENLPGQSSPSYLNCLKIIEQVLTDILKTLQEQFSKYFNFSANVTVISQLESIVFFKGRMEQIQEKEINIDSTLLNIALNPVKEFIEKGKKTGYSYQKIDYFDTLLHEIESIDNACDNTSISLTNALISINFNGSWFLKYLINKISEELKKEDSLSKNLQVLSSYLKFYNQVNVRPDFALEPNNVSIKALIISWIYEEIDYLEKEIRIKEFIKQLGECSEAGIKIQTGLSVAQLGFFLKLLVDCDVIKNPKQTDVIRFFSQNISTKQTETVSLSSLSSKYYNHEENNKIVVKEYLIRMINEVNKRD